MKIAFISTYFHPFKGGAEKYFLNLALYLVKQGHEVHVYTSDRKNKERIEEKEEIYKGIKIHRLKVWLRIKYYFAFYPALLPKILFNQFDVIHVSSFGFLWHDKILILKKLFSPKTKFINTPHGPFMTLDYNNSLRGLIKRVLTIIQKIYLNWLYDIVLEDNKYQNEWIHKEYGIRKDKIKYLPVGIDNNIIGIKFREKDLIKFREENNLKQKLIISYLGRFANYKGIDHLVKAFAMINKKYKQTHLLIMGKEENFYSQIIALIKNLKIENHVCVMENVSEEKKLIGLDVSEIFVLPSKWEAFGIVTAEAMARGNAVISTDTEGGKTLIKPEENGFLIKYGDINSLTQHLGRLIKDTSLRNKIILNNYRKIRNYIWETILPSYLELIVNLQVKH